MPRSKSIVEHKRAVAERRKNGRPIPGTKGVVVVNSPHAKKIRQEKLSIEREIDKRERELERRRNTDYIGGKSGEIVAHLTTKAHEIYWTRNSEGKLEKSKRTRSNA